MLSSILRSLGVAAILSVCLICIPRPAAAAAFENRALILYDTASKDESVKYRAHDDILVSLLGHFNLASKRQPVNKYKKGQIAEYKATFYIGNRSGAPLPESFLRDVLYSKRPVVWINFNLAQLAMSPEYKPVFEERFGFRYRGPLHTNPFDQVWFRNRTFSRQQERIGRTRVLDDKKVRVFGLAITEDHSRYFPYIVKSDNLTYVADNPMEVWYEDQAYIVFAETLHTILNQPHKVERLALARLENIDAEDNPQRLRSLGDLFESERVPFSFIVIPRFTDPLGTTGVPRTTDLDQAQPVVNALKYLQRKRGRLVMHGFTHQYGAVKNPFSGMSGDDAEFILTKYDFGSLVPVASVPEETNGWIQWRLDQGFAVLNRAGLGRPRMWVTPNYLASRKAYRTFSKNFAALNDRDPDAFYPYIIHRDVNGNKIIPENLGFPQPRVTSAKDIVERAERNLVVRDGVAGFFFHPEYDDALLRDTIRGIKGLGYKFVDIETLL